MKDPRTEILYLLFENVIEYLRVALYVSVKDSIECSWSSAWMNLLCPLGAVHMVPR